MKKYLLFVVGLVITLVSFSQRKIVVAQDKTGDYTTVKEALDAAPDSADTETIIYIRKGVYKERLTLPATKSKIHLIGDDAATTKLTFDNYASKKDAAGKAFGTSGSASFFIYGSDFTAENITFENSSGPVGQALAVYVAGDRSKFIKCRFLGFQDTIYTHKRSRQYYEECYIEGATDFIFGPAVAVFNKCTVFCKKGGQYLTAASTDEGAKFGYVFLNCKVTGDAPSSSCYLGRPWKPFAKVVFIKSTLGPQIKPEGWHNWNNASNEKTAYYAEYKNKGKGFKPKERVQWSHQLTKEEAQEYTVANIFKDWKP